ncbi:MAG: type IV pilus modification PilV family protein [Bacillota bacterium]
MNSSSKGLTLVEIVVAGLIFALAIVPLMNMFDLSAANVLVAGKRSMALILAQQKIEDIKALGAPPAGSEEEGVFAGYPGYAYEMTVNSQGTLKEVTVEVRFLSRNREQKISLTTLVRN